MFLIFNNWYKIQNDTRQLLDIAALVKHKQKFKMAAISKKMNIDSKHKQFTLLQKNLNFWKVNDTFKWLSLCLITKYRLIFLCKAQMAANSIPFLISIQYIPSQI